MAAKITRLDKKLIKGIMVTVSGDYNKVRPKKTVKPSLYADFKEIVIKVLSVNKEPLSWSEIRELGGLSRLGPAAYG